MSAYLADSPLTCVVLGSGRSLEEFDVMSDSGIREVGAGAATARRGADADPRSQARPRWGHRGDRGPAPALLPGIREGFLSAATPSSPQAGCSRLAQRLGRVPDVVAMGGWTETPSPSAPATAERGSRCVRRCGCSASRSSYFTSTHERSHIAMACGWRRRTTRRCARCSCGRGARQLLPAGASTSRQSRSLQPSRAEVPQV